MITIDEMIANRETLSKHLTLMRDGHAVPSQCMEYGHPSEPGGFMSYLRIRWMNTAGGPQFRICELYHGREGSGDYTPELSEILLKAEQMVHHYHRSVTSSVFKQELERRRAQRVGSNAQEYRRSLCWFPLIPSLSFAETGRTSSYAPILPGEVVVELKGY